MHAFLFTDLESSTRLWEEHPEEMKEAMMGLNMVELQARTRLVPLLRGIGEDDEIDQLRAVHESIRGGDDEPDVQDARRLLD